MGEIWLRGEGQKINTMFMEMIQHEKEGGNVKNKNLSSPTATLLLTELLNVCVCGPLKVKDPLLLRDQY